MRRPRDRARGTAVTSPTLKRAGFEANAGQRLVAIDHERFDQGAYANGITDLCPVLGVLGNNRPDPVQYTARKPDGKLLTVNVEY